jgi:MoaA/NifB/PqqE/SkfB family radical SAM enzyme
MAGLLDVILGYDCNLACDYCTITPAMRTRSLAAPALLAAMRRGRALDYDRIAFTGGEPTIRRDLVGLIKAARSLGYRDVKLQSNGLLFTPANVARLIDAGVSRFHVSIHAHRPDAYDVLVRRAGSFAAMAEGLRTAVGSGLPVVVDAIVKTDTYPHLPAAIEWVADQGVGEVHLWYVSLTDGNRDNLASLPAMTDAVPSMREAMALARARGIEIRSLHVPRCLLGDDWQHAWDPGAQRVMVVTPEASFELSESRLAGQTQVPACAGCRFEAICPGIRPDYLEQFGDGEIARARGLPSSRTSRRRLPVLAPRRAEPASEGLTLAELLEFVDAHADHVADRRGGLASPFEDRLARAWISTIAARIDRTCESPLARIDAALEAARTTFVSLRAIGDSAWPLDDARTGIDRFIASAGARMLHGWTNCEGQNLLLAQLLAHWFDRVELVSTCVPPDAGHTLVRFAGPDGICWADAWGDAPLFRLEGPEYDAIPQLETLLASLCPPILPDPFPSDDRLRVGRVLASFEATAPVVLVPIAPELVQGLAAVQSDPWSTYLRARAFALFDQLDPALALLRSASSRTSDPALAELAALHRRRLEALANQGGRGPV